MSAGQWFLIVLAVLLFASTPFMLIGAYHEGKIRREKRERKL